MKLTKTLREKITFSAVNALLPVVHTSESWQKVADEIIYPYLRSVIDPKVLAVWDDPKLMSHLHRNNEVRVALRPAPQSGPFNWYDYDCAKRVFMTEYLPTCESYFRITYEEAPDVSLLVQNKHLAEKTENKARDQLRSRLRDVLNSCNTTAQLAEALPEVMRFVPAEASPYPVPVAVYENLRRDLQMLAERSHA